MSATGQALKASNIITALLQARFGRGRARRSVADPPAPRLEFNGNELAAGAAGVSQFTYLGFLRRGGYLVVGWSHLLAGSPRSGKTELLVQLMQEWLDEARRILFITEESEDLWRKRLSGLRRDWSGLQVYFGLGVHPKQLRRRAFSGGEDVVVLDAARNLLQLRDENDNSEIARVFNPWIIEARKAGKTLIVVHHTRKAQGEHGEAIAGGHALLGAFDIGLELVWGPREARRRTIRVYPRIIRPPELTYEMGDDGELRTFGDPKIVIREESLSREGVSARVLAAVSPEWQYTRTIWERLGEPRPTEEHVRMTLVQAARAALIERDPPISDGNARGKHHRWRRVPRPPSSVPTIGSLVGTELGSSGAAEPQPPVVEVWDVSPVDVMESSSTAGVEKPQATERTS